jgi:hypothetical protein
MESYQYNFMLVDGVHYRYEPSRLKCEAVAIFGNADDGDYLNQAFTSIASAAIAVPL